MFAVSFLSFVENKAEILLPVDTVANRSFEEVSQVVKAIHTQGGTTLMTGFNEANSSLMKYLEKKEYVKNNCAENRLIMLTDVTDNSIGMSKQFVA